MRLQMNRRRFLKHTIGAAAIGFPAVISGRVLGAGGTTPPSEKIVMGSIGAGGMGGGHLRTFLGQDDVQLVAVCDLFEERRNRAVERVNTKYGNNACAAYRDYRELLARPDIDAVCIATPDHWHVLIGIEAAKNKKHMYYEKPLAVSIAECQAIRSAVTDAGVVFQFGTQQRSENTFRQALDLVRAGRIGKLQTIMLGSASYEQEPLQKTQPVPAGFDYDMWLGPAPVAPYCELRCTRQWTLLADYSLGCIGGAWGIHHVDIAQWAAGADDTGPVEVEGTGTIPDGFYDTPQHFTIEHKYANGIKMIHMDQHTARDVAEQFKLALMGILFIGSEGWIYSARGFFDAEPKSLTRVPSGAEGLRPMRGGHNRNFLDCIKSGRKTVSPIEVATHSDIVTHLDYIAVKLGRRLRWDPAKEQFINDAEANRMLSRPMRSPWHL